MSQENRRKCKRSISFNDSPCLMKSFTDTAKGCSTSEHPVYVHGIPPNITLHSLKEHMEINVGPVTHINFFRVDGITRISAEVYFNSYFNAKNAAESQKTLDSCTISCSLCAPILSFAYLSEEQRTRTLLVKNVTPQATEHDLFLKFSRFGKLEGVIINRTHDFISKGTAYVLFSSLHNVEFLLASRASYSHRIHGKKVFIYRCSKKTDWQSYQPRTVAGPSPYNYSNPNTICTSVSSPEKSSHYQSSPSNYNSNKQESNDLDDYITDYIEGGPHPDTNIELEEKAGQMESLHSCMRAYPHLHSGSTALSLGHAGEATRRPNDNSQVNLQLENHSRENVCTSQQLITDNRAEPYMSGVTTSLQCLVKDVREVNSYQGPQPSILRRLSSNIRNLFINYSDSNPDNYRFNRCPEHNRRRESENDYYNMIRC